MVPFGLEVDAKHSKAVAIRFCAKPGKPKAHRSFGENWKWSFSTVFISRIIEGSFLIKTWKLTRRAETSFKESLLGVGYHALFGKMKKSLLRKVTVRALYRSQRQHHCLGFGVIPLTSDLKLISGDGGFAGERVYSSGSTGSVVLFVIIRRNQFILQHNYFFPICGLIRPVLRAHPVQCSHPVDVGSISSMMSSSISSLGEASISGMAGSSGSPHRGLSTTIDAVLQ